MKLRLSYGRIIVLLGILSLVLALSACGSTQDVNSDQPIVPTKPTSGQGSTASQGSTPVAGQAPTSTFSYKSAIITIVSTDQQKQFKDDDQSSGSMVVRVNIHEQNPTEQSVYVTYDQSARLILPDGRSIAPATKASSVIEPGIVRNSWLDFSVDSQQDLNKSILRIGTENEHQMNISLASNRDLTKYQARSITPNTKVQYGVNWTVAKVTTSLSADGEQASTGNRYIIVTLQANNATEADFYPTPSENIRLKSNTAVQAPKSTTLPGSIAAHSNGTTGTVTFLVPENDSNLQLQFLAQPKEGINAAYANFQIWVQVA
ncbi:MAG: DUF4352 domain-containing protein [Ktedonobacteraceae bacterium]|nr:DUF4352 domain-containing protein [Ktedonobacteraceae bacterium]